MDKQLHDIETTGPKHRSSARRPRRLGASVGALLTGGALVLGTASMAGAAVHDPIPKGYSPLYDNCGTGFSGSVTWTDGAQNDTITVRFKPSAGYSAADVDVRADVKDSRGRDRVVRYRTDFETLTAGTVESFTIRNAPANAKVWRVSVGAIEAGPLGTEVHALEAENDPAACD